MKLNPNEKIDSWDVVVKTTEGRELTFIDDLGIGQLPHKVTQAIDEILENKYPVTWTGDEFPEPCIDCENNSSEKCNHCFNEDE